MADINKDVGDHGGSEDYATLTLWNAGEGSADPGAGFLSIANCSGDCGTIANINGTFIRGAKIQGDVTYDMTNESALAFTTRLYTTSDDINIFDMKITESNNFQNTYKPLGTNSFATRCRIIHTGTPTLNNGNPVALNSASANKGVRNCVISTSGEQLIRFGFDNPAIIDNVVGFGGTIRGLLFAGSNQTVTDCYFYDCNGVAYIGSSDLVHCASDDLTATAGFQSIASSALVAVGSDNYQSKSGGALDVSPFIGALLEVSSGITITVEYQALTNLIGRETVSYQTLVNLLTTTTKNYQTLLNLLNEFTLNYTVDSDLIGRGVTNYSSEFNLLAERLKDFEINLDLLSQNTLVTPYTILLDLKELVTTTYEVNLNLLYSDLLGYSVNLNLLNLETVDHQSLIKLLGLQTTEYTTNVDFLQSVDKSFQINLDMLSQGTVVTPFSVLIDLREQVTSQFTADLDFLNTVTRDHEIVATLLNAVTMDFINKFDLNAQVTTDYSISLDYIGRVNKTYDVVFSIQSDLTPRIPMHYVITLGGNIKFENEAITVEFSNPDGDNLTV